MQLRLRPQAGHRMVAQNWTKSLVKIALLMIAGAGTVCYACAQQSTSGGALDG